MEYTEYPSQSTLRRRVGRGIALLDEKGPSNWRERVNLDTLDLSSLTDCVLGQVFGGWSEGSDALFGGTFGHMEEQKHHGFEGTKVYGALTEEWKRRLSK